jgi:hypothetical protein
MKYTRLLGLLVTLALLEMPLVIVVGAGRRIEGKVVDPKGAIVVGATVTVTDPGCGSVGPKKSCMPCQPVVRCRLSKPSVFLNKARSACVLSEFFPQNWIQS